MWRAPERNMSGIQFESIRQAIDDKFNKVHDELSDCYYNKKPFRRYGILTKEQFDKLHALIFLYRDVAFHAENMRRPAKERIDEAEYNYVLDGQGRMAGKLSSRSAQKIAELRAQGFVLEDL